MRMKKSANARGWSDSETVALAQVYRHMSELQAQGKLGRGNGKVSKSSLVKPIAAGQARSVGSIEAKLMNMSAVVESLGDDSSVRMVTGYKPLPNMSRSCREIVSNAFRKG